MKKLILILVLFLTACSASTPVPLALTPMIPGVDALGLAKYCDQYTASRKLPGLSTLMTSFGNPLPCIRRNIDSLSLIQIDIRDATCFRNGVCPPGTPLLTDWNFMASKVKRINRLATEYPDRLWWVSPWLEHDIKDQVIVRKGCQVVRENCPTCKCINSPFSGATPSGIPIERHGTSVRSYSVSGDGMSSFDADNLRDDANTFQHRTSGVDQTYGWWNELNLRCTGEENFTPIADRTVRPELWQFNMLHKIFSTEEDVIPPAPPQCRTVRRIKAPEINKPLAERYCNGETDDGRGNKPLLILKKSGQRNQGLPVFRSDGNQIGCFKYFGPYTQTGLWRWYMGSCSGNNAWQIHNKAGSEWVYVGIGNNNCLLVNIIRREGVYR